MATSVNAVNKLNGQSNWTTWKFETKIILKGRGLMDVVTGTTKKPQEKDASTWMSSDAKAQEIIVTRMDPGPQSHILTCDTSAEMWKKLHSVYEKESIVSVHILQQRFFAAEFGQRTVSEFLSDLEEIRLKLKHSGEMLSDNMVITKVLMSLPTTFKHFRSAWESAPSDKQTLEELTSRLLLEEEREKRDETTTALITTSNKKTCQSCGKAGHLNKDCYKLKTCQYCKKMGHIEKFCFFKKNKSSKKQRNIKMDLPTALVASALEAPSDSWFMDSGCTHHMCKDKNYFENYKALEYTRMVHLGDGAKVQVIGEGNIKLNAFNGKCWSVVNLENVFFVPELKVNLFSVVSALDKGLQMLSNNTECKFIKNNKIIVISKRVDRLFKMCFNSDEKALSGISDNGMINNNVKSNDYCNNDCDLYKYHCKLGHQNFIYIKNILKINNINVKCSMNHFCAACVEGKQHCSPHPKSASKTSNPGEIIHADLCGPLEEKSLGGSKYFLLIKDDYSHYRKVYPLSEKNQAAGKLEVFITCSINQGIKIKTLRTDNGGEFVNNSVKRMLELHGIIHQTSVAYTPAQNGKIEREMRTVMEATRTMLKAKSLNKNLWAEAVNTAVYILNRTGTSTLPDKTPYELWTKRQFDISLLKGIFGEEVWTHIPKQQRLKLDSKARKGIFVGYGENIKGYKIYYPDNGTFSYVREVIFSSLNETTKTTYNVNNNFEIQSQGQPDDEVENINKDQLYGNGERPKRNTRRPKRLDDYDLCYFAMDSEEPTSLSEAMSSTHAEQWNEAMRYEMAALDENDTWTIVKKPESKVLIIDTKWVFKVKRNKEGKINLFKARLVARGFRQNNLNYSDIYSPVVKMVSVRTMLALSNKKGWPVYQLDVCSAFLNGVINDDIYITLPSNFVIENNNLCKLNKALYGLKGAPKAWYQKFNDFILSHNFKKSTSDLCLYYFLDNNCKVFVLIFVDDVLCTGYGSMVNYIMEQMKIEFKMKDMGLASFYLGLNINQDLNNGTTTLDQSQYLKGILQKFNMLNCHDVATPMDQNLDLSKLKRPQSENDELEHRCRQLIGCIMYAMIGTRPDLCSSISFLSRYQTCASNELWICLKRILRYIKGSIDLKLIYNKSVSDTLITGFADADWGSDRIDRRSTSGFCFLIYGNLVAWSSKKQATVAMSSCEAEYVALSQCISEACWLRNMLTELKINNNIIVIIYEDNQSAIKACNSYEQLKRMKHLDIKYHFIRDKVQSGIIKVEYVYTKEQMADILTKPLNRHSFEKLRHSMGLRVV